LGQTCLTDLWKHLLGHPYNLFGADPHITLHRTPIFTNLVASFLPSWKTCLRVLVITMPLLSSTILDLYRLIDLDKLGQKSISKTLLNLTKPLPIINDLLHTKPLLPLLRLSTSSFFFFLSPSPQILIKITYFYPRVQQFPHPFYVTILYIHFYTEVICITSSVMHDILVILSWLAQQYIWHASIATTSQQRLLKYILPIENKMRKCLSTITLMSSFIHFSLKRVSCFSVLRCNLFNTSTDTIFSRSYHYRWSYSMHCC